MCENNLKEPKHHVQQNLCKTRPPYRQGKKLTAVKAYTINNESQHLFVYGVPKINLRKELKQLFANYGQVLQIHVVTDHKTEAFTECFHVQFERIQSARIAKRLLDNKSFYGSVLHVCYAPEHESVDETRTKLMQRCKDVLSRLGGSHQQQTPPETFVQKSIQNTNRKRKHPALEINEERLQGAENVWEGIPEELDPRLPPKLLKESHPQKHYQLEETTKKSVIYGPNLEGSDNSADDKTNTRPPPKTTQMIPTQVRAQISKETTVKRIVFKKK